MFASRLADAPVAAAARPGRAPAALRLRRELRGVHAVIDRQAVVVDVAPLVRPATGDLVGFEILVRGSADSPFTSARALRQAAAAVGRLGELDWLARAAAARALGDAEVDPSVTVFFEADGRSLYQPCPPDAVADVHRMLNRWDCVVRLDPGHSTTLAHAMVAGTDQLRAAGFTVALDGPPMGIPSGSMLRCFEPEMVAVDARALVALARTDGPRAVPALGEFYRRAGRRLVARHVDDDDGLEVARRIGAAFAQGDGIGRPAPLAGIRR